MARKRHTLMISAPSTKSRLPAPTLANNAQKSGPGTLGHRHMRRFGRHLSKKRPRHWATRSPPSSSERALLMKEWKPKEQIVLEVNPDYAGRDKPFFKRIVAKPITEPKTAVISFLPRSSLSPKSSRRLFRRWKRTPIRNPSSSTVSITPGSASMSKSRPLRPQGSSGHPLRHRHRCDHRRCFFRYRCPGKDASGAAAPRPLGGGPCLSARYRKGEGTAGGSRTDQVQRNAHLPQ